MICYKFFVARECYERILLVNVIKHVIEPISTISSVA